MERPYCINQSDEEVAKGCQDFLARRAFALCASRRFLTGVAGLSASEAGSPAALCGGLIGNALFSNSSPGPFSKF